MQRKGAGRLILPEKLRGWGVMRMSHSTIRATILPIIVSKIAEQYHISEDAARDAFYRSATGASFADDETGLYGQSPNFIFGLYLQERNEQSIL